MCIMLVVTGVVFAIATAIWGFAAGIIIAALFLGAWWLVNVRAATTGLIKANLRAYFTALSRGASEEEALAWVIQTRYPESPERQAQVQRTHQLSQGGYETAEDRIKSLILTIFSTENGPPPPKYAMKITRKIDEVYETMSAKHARVCQ